MQAFICAIYSFRGLHSNYYNITINQQYIVKSRKIPPTGVIRETFLPRKFPRVRPIYTYWIACWIHPHYCFL